jgi:hypothetical protein
MISQDVHVLHVHMREASGYEIEMQRTGYRSVIIAESYKSIQIIQVSAQHLTLPIEVQSLV